LSRQFFTKRCGEEMTTKRSEEVEEGVEEVEGKESEEDATDEMNKK
jgi:hypothetical protein